MSLAILPHTDSRASLLGPSDSASQQTGSYQSILDPVTERLMEALMELVEPPPMRPSYVLKSVLWDFKDCLDLVEGVIITEANMLRLVGRSVRRARGGVILKSTTNKGGLL
jgi:hypothetical protein